MQAVARFARPEMRFQAVSETNPDEEGSLAAQIVQLRPQLLRFAWSLTRDREVAEDLAQETIARALAAQWRFQPGTNLKAWLFRILRNVQLNLLRAAGTRPAVVSIEELAAEPVGLHDHLNPVEARVIERANLRRIAAAYRTLPSAFALPLYLTAIEELSYAEAASILDIPIGTVMSRIHRARRLLVSRLMGEGS
jgi:RNA polymerase sigma-70 factor (ECF subfamily)